MFKLPPEVEKALEEARALDQHYRTVFASMTDGNLIACAKFWMQHCDAPKRVAPDEPIYDSTFWHVIVPEILNRLGDK